MWSFLCALKNSVVAAFRPKICRNLAGNFCLRQTSANPDIGRIFGSAGLISLKTWLGSLFYIFYIIAFHQYIIKKILSFLK